MDPYSGKAIETVIELTVGVLFQKINQAKTLAQDDVMRCKLYLEAAGEAIQGLENEYDAIINQAETCRIDRRKDIRVLRKRILDYLHLDRFRKVLWEVHAGLQGCRNALQANNQRLLILPGIKAQRQEAITDFVNTLETLEQYIADLQNQDLSSRPAGTGVGIKWLNDIDRKLSQAEDLYNNSVKPKADWLKGIRKDLNAIVHDARKDRSKDKLKTSTTRIRDSIDKLQRAFR